MSFLNDESFWRESAFTGGRMKGTVKSSPLLLSLDVLG